MFGLSLSTYPIGLDISDLSLKVFQLNKRGDSIKIQAIGKAELPKGLIEGGEIRNRSEIVKAIKQLLDKPQFGKISSKEAVVCLPEPKTFIKLIQVEKTPNDFEEMLKAEMQKHIPLSLDEIYYDWQIIRDAPGSQQVLIGAAPKTTVDQYSALVDACGLSVAALEIESVAICRSLLSEEHYRFKGSAKTNYGLIDIGARRASMTVYSENTILFSVSIPISSDKITEEIARILKLDMKQAEKAKIICGLDETRAQGIVKNVLSGMINELTVKIKEVIKYYQYHYPAYGPLKEIQLCGGGANIENLDKILTEALAVAVIAGNPLKNLAEAKEKFSEVLTETHKIEESSKKGSKNKSQEKDRAVTQDSSLTYATAIGLALRGIFIDDL